MINQPEQSGYEELIIDDVLCWRVDGDPTGVYRAYTAEHISALVCELREILRSYTGGF